MSAGSLRAVIGLEVHLQLATSSKIFCGCATHHGAAANTHVCETCTGQPGALPVLNHKAVDLALRMALAVDATVRRLSRFARKNYFYADLPKGYQISQYDQPLAEGGAVQMWLEGRRHQVPLTRLHLEEDAGKSIHRQDAVLVDLNRAGVPLLEIVSEPCIRSPGEAAEFMRALRDMARALGISDGKMEQGSLRCDANLSLAPREGGPPGTRVEIKNLNSFRFVHRALEYEISRQRAVLSRGDEVRAETRQWDQKKNATAPMRAKEEAGDYRYFTEPDLPPLEVGQDWIERVRASLPELPAMRRGRLMDQLGLSFNDATELTRATELADYLERTVAAGAAPKRAANWVLSELLSRVREPRDVASAPVAPPALADLLELVQKELVSDTAARAIWSRMWDGDGRPPRQIAEEEELLLLRDAAALEAAVNAVLAQHPQEVKQYRGGKDKLLGFFVGQVMRASGGRADPREVNDEVRRQLEG